MGIGKGIATFLFVTSIGIGIGYFGGGALIIKQHSIEENRQLYQSPYTDGLIKFLIKLYCKEATIPTSPSQYYNNSDVSSKIEEVKRKINDGELTIEEGERIIQNIGDAYLGEGKTKKIMDIMEKEQTGEISEREATRRIIDEVPTGLPSGLERAVKDFSIFIEEKATEK